MPLGVFLQQLPKAELHLHLEGSVEPATLLEIQPGLSMDTAQAQFQYNGFAGFLKAYVWVSRQLDTPFAYRLATRRLLEKLVSQNVRLAEITLSAGVILWKGERLEPIYEEINQECQLHPGIQVRWIFDAIRQFGPEPAAKVFALAERYREAGVAAIGIGGDEERGPATWFADLYARAKNSGLGLTCHAGEVTGPQSVWDALRIGSQRIGHGIRSIDDPALVDYLREHDIPLEICPSSNIRTGAVASLAKHPIRRLWEAGVPIILGSDDPALFGTDLIEEYRIITETFGFLRNELAQLAENSFRYSFAQLSTGLTDPFL